jgi:hypothetical protein
MTRLRNEAGLDPISERGIEMLRRTPATHSSADRKRRVWISLQRTAVRNARRRSGGLEGLLLGTLGVAVATTAVAAIGGRWIAGAHARGGAPAGVAPAGRTPHARGTAARRIAARDEAPAFATSTLEPATSAEPAGGRIHSLPARKAERPAPAARPAVLDALIALRRDHAGARAASLLDRYLAVNRHGALREEALALAIEAADAERDPPRARLFAGAYVNEYPTGRFAPFARRHLGEPVGDAPAEALSAR